MTNPFENVAVIGAGFMGTQIAMLSAFSGYKVSVMVGFPPHKKVGIIIYE